MESRTQTMDEVLEHEAKECSNKLVKQLQAFESLVAKEFRTQFFSLIETQLQSAFYTGLAKSRSIVRDRQSEVQGENK